MRSPSTDFEEVTAALRALEVPYALIGGWAVIAWGFVRVSDDLDFIVDVSRVERRALLNALADKWDAEVEEGGEDDPIPWLIRMRRKGGGIPIDLLPVRNQADRDAIVRAKEVKIDGHPIQVVSVEDLIAMKLEAGGGQDYVDVRRLLSVVGAKIDESGLRQSCGARKVLDRLDLARSRP